MGTRRRAKGTTSRRKAADPSVRDASLYDRIYRLVREIPSGEVATYGQLASIVGSCTPRQAGYAMAHAPADIPWHRVLNSAGQVSERRSGSGARKQRKLLESEGVDFSAAGTLNFKHCGWGGPGAILRDHHGWRSAPPAGWRSSGR